MSKKIYHAEYQQMLKGKTDAQLRFIVKDAREAEEANPTGENAGYYADEQHYAAMELTKRTKNIAVGIRALLS